MKTLAIHLVLLLTLALGLGCASTGSPSGGPVDDLAPVIVHTFPLPGSVQVPSDVQIEITFSEPVSTRQLSKAFSLSPPPPGAVRAKWRGETVRISFDPPLMEDRTYVLSIGTTLTDLRRIALRETFHLPFSTGDSLDMGQMGGNLEAAGALNGWSIIGYRLGGDSLAADPDPAYDLPDAATQTNFDGTWELLHLREGVWRIFAFKDNDGDRLWTPWAEQVGVPPYDVDVYADSTLTSRQVTPLPVNMPVLPVPMRLVSMVRNVLELRLDRKPATLEAEFELRMPSDSLRDEYDFEFALEDTALQVVEWRFKIVDSTTVQLPLSGMPVGDGLALQVHGKFGTDKLLDTLLVVDLTSSAEQDTFRPGLVHFSPEANSRLHSGRDVVNLLFSKKMKEIPRGAITLVYMEPADTLIPVVGQNDPWHAAFLVDITRAGDMQVQLHGFLLQDEFGNIMEDSLRVIRYSVLPPDSLGRIAGSVITPIPGSSVYLQLQSISGRDLTLERTVTGGGEFLFDKVPAGEWRLRGWIDSNGNLEWDRGMPMPFNPSEPVHLGQDTITVRARWESGALRFIFP